MKEHFAQGLLNNTSKLFEPIIHYSLLLIGAVFEYQFGFLKTGFPTDLVNLAANKAKATLEEDTYCAMLTLMWKIPLIPRDVTKHPLL